MEDMSEEKLHLTRHVEDLKESLRHCEEENNQNRLRINELIQRLSESHNAREEGVYRAAR